MTAVTLVNPEIIKQKIGTKTSYKTLISKPIGREYISTDLNFTEYSNMTDEHKKEYNSIENIDKSNLLNI